MKEMKAMDVSIKDDCAVETVMPVKKKKMKQAQLPFHTSSSSKSPSSNNVPNKKKRKITTPLAGSKSPKILKFTTKENSEDDKDVDEIKLDSSSDSNEIILDKEKKDLEEDNQQNHEKNKKIDTTPSKNSLRKSKKLDKCQKKTGALNKFLKKAEKEAKSNINNDNSLCESKSDQGQQNTSAQEEKNEICLNENPSKQSSESQVNEKSDDADIADDANQSLCQELDSDVAILSSDNETANELDKTISNKNKEINSKSTTPKTPKTSKNMKERIKKLTPKQLEKRKEIAKRKEEKLRLKEEKEKQREEEKANRQRQREQKQREKEEKERIEKEQKKKEKELKELKKQMEIEQKQKEKEAKEEERRKREEAKEEEKRKREEEKLEAERKKQKAASNFASFFVSKKQEVKSAEEESIVEARNFNFMPFEIKADMKIAPVCRRILNEHDKLVLDEICNANSKKSELYLQDIKTGKISPRISSKTWPLEAKDNDIIILDDDNDGSSNIITDTHKLEKHRPKLLQFHENRRPPYWGTWQKQSNVLKPRRPFAKEEKWFDYEVDSDDEWEEEEPGESLKGSDDEKEKDEENPEENEYDVDNEFMVPHGYLSDEEAQGGEEEMEDMSPQTQKMKLKILGEQFEAERNVKTSKLKPKIIGCIWQERKNLFPESISAKIKEFLSARQTWVNNIPIILPLSTSMEEDVSPSAECKTQTPQSVRGPKKTKFPNEALPDLIRLLHGNTYGRHFLMKEFMTFWSKNNEKQLSKVSVIEKINEIASKVACPEEGPMHLKSCWYVSEEYRKQYLPDEELPLPNRWKYILTPSRKSDTQDSAVDKVEKEEKEKEKEKERKHVPLITQFTKIITQEDMKKQLTKPDQEESKKQVALKSDQVSVSPKPPLQRPPKRATLISVGRGEQFSEKSRENILAKFVNLNEKKEEPSSSERINVNSDDVVFIESIDKGKAERKKELTNK